MPWLSASATTQAAGRATVETCTSSISPTRPAPSVSAGAAAKGAAAVATGWPFTYSVSALASQLSATWCQALSDSGVGAAARAPLAAATGVPCSSASVRPP
jgi:hypothetical protein